MRRGWPSRMTDSLLPYWRREQLTLEGDGIFLGIRVVGIISELHQGHSGIVRMKTIARSHVWWPNIDKELEQCARARPACQVSRNLPAKAPLHPGRGQLLHGRGFMWISWDQYKERCFSWLLRKKFKLLDIACQE